MDIFGGLTCIDWSSVENESHIRKEEVKDMVCVSVTKSKRGVTKEHRAEFCSSRAGGRRESEHTRSSEPFTGLGATSQLARCMWTRPQHWQWWQGRPLKPRRIRVVSCRMEPMVSCWTRVLPRHTPRDESAVYVNVDRLDKDTPTKIGSNCLVAESAETWSGDGAIFARSSKSNRPGDARPSKQ